MLFNPRTIYNTHFIKNQHYNVSCANATHYYKCFSVRKQKAQTSVSNRCCQRVTTVKWKISYSSNDLYSGNVRELFIIFILINQGKVSLTCKLPRSLAATCFHMLNIWTEESCRLMYIIRVFNDSARLLSPVPWVSTRRTAICNYSKMKPNITWPIFAF